MKMRITRRVREAILAPVSFLPLHRRIALERWLRGWEESRRLAEADLVVVSFGKSGRTWLRVMMSRYYQILFKIPKQYLLSFSNFHRRDKRIPKVLFTHDNYLRDYTGDVDSKASFYKKKVVLLIRNPKDVAVSQYFQWKFRMRPQKKLLNGYPPHGAEILPYEFVMDPNCGIPHIIDYLNLWAKETDRMEDLLIVRYEDMRHDAATALRQIMEFANGGPADEASIAEAVEFASVENMRKLERDSAFENGGSRMKPGQVDNENSYKVRRAKVGGYKDHFSESETALIDETVEKNLSAAFGYSATKQLERT